MLKSLWHILSWIMEHWDPDYEDGSNPLGGPEL